MTLSEELVWRGFVQDTTLPDIKDLDKQDWVVYIGFDASASSQTIGNLASMMAIKTFLRHGHKVILLAGGATSLIGDPGGKTKEREQLAKEAVATNVANAVAQLKAIIGESDKITYVNNLDWYADCKLLDFLREIGKNVSMTPLVQRDYIAARMQSGTGISYAEFSYTLLQGYDYLQLFRQMGCNLQLGGSDQWGNCISGVDLIRRLEQQTVHAMTMPLIINKATGQKFGKTEQGAIWLDPQLTHPADFYQFWLNTTDADATNYLKIFTELNPPEIQQIENDSRGPEERVAQIALAEWMTSLVHGEETRHLCRMAASLAFARRTVTTDAQTINNMQDLFNVEATKIILSRHNPHSQHDYDELIAKIPALTSRRQVKEMLQAQAIKCIYVDNETKTLHIETELPVGVPDKKPLLIVVGKNTIRGFEIQSNN